MYLKDLIGKFCIRTAPLNDGPVQDRTYMTTICYIVKINSDGSILIDDTDEKILDSKWDDGNWKERTFITKHKMEPRSLYSSTSIVQDSHGNSYRHGMYPGLHRPLNDKEDKELEALANFISESWIS